VIGTIVFVLAFVALGLVVVLLAMRSGRRAPDDGSGQSRTARRAQYAGFAVVLLAIGVAVPALAIVNNRNEQSKQGPGGLELTDAQARGQELFAQNCSTCHTLKAANAVGRVGPNLDAMRPPAALVAQAIETGRARGQGQMPARLLVGEDQKDVAEYVATVAGR
jgi:mono/diheme cytochrome c family protein